MRKSLTTLLAGAALATLGGAASAQFPFPLPPPYDYGYGGGQTATLYELPNFQGRSVLITGENGNLDGIGFNDRARSARFQGTWNVCADSNYRGHCEALSGNVAYLPPRLTGSASSLRASAGYDGGYPGGGYGTPGYGGGTATLYEHPNYQGRSVVITREQGNLDSIGFNDRARSARFDGTWRVCEDAGFRGRCETFTGAVPNLALRINGASSLQVTGAGYPGGGYPGYPGYGQGVEGTSVVFFPGPVGGGTYGSPYGRYTGTRRAADDFCRQMGHRSSVYYDTAGGTLSDVLCRR